MFGRPGAVLFMAVLLLASCASRPEGEPAGADPADAAEPQYEAIAVSGGGGITGTVRYAGPELNLPQRPITKNADVCGRGSLPSVEVVAAQDGGLRNVVVSIEGIRRGKAAGAANPVLDQEKCEYLPHVQSATVGQTLDILNSDDILHNVHGKLDGRATLFNIAMPLKGQKLQKVLARPGVIHLQCDAGHTWMQAYIAVFPHPYHATTDAAGRFSLGEIPPGSYKLRAWHERFGSLEQDVTVTAGADTPVSFEFR